MDKYENGPPIQTIFNGSNYVAWSQAMQSKEKLQDRLEEWDSKNHQAITWLHNSCVPSINVQFGRYETAKEVWDLLASRYTTADLAHQYQILISLANLKHEQGQLVADFLPQMQSLWDQLSMSEPKWKSSEDAILFQTYRDQQRLMQFLMPLH
ncbi:hypothetical protein NE237_029615 [Protea cynaroides]|uniref:Gag protein n=1 Tax=Protea cynaroides TaxID=273540 RepID=A0A9Q0GS47_9MAGN|nr:hypothetical protein NE237_029615 [Protea cynaroides]